MKWDTDTFIFILFCSNEYICIFFFLNTQAMNILSEPIVNNVILWENRDLQFIQKKKLILYLSRIVQL